MIETYDANLELVNVVIVADEEHVGKSLVWILTLKIVQDSNAEVWSTL